MLLKLLSTSDKAHLLQLAELMALADKPLLWDGKTKNEALVVTSGTDPGKLSFQKGAQETAMLAELKSEGESAESTPSLFRVIVSVNSINSVETKLMDRIKQRTPLYLIDEPENRAQAATSVLNELLKDKVCETPSVPKLMLFELILMALCNGSISGIEMTLLKEFQRHYQLEDFVFDDLLERAEAMSQEIGKTISIILE